ncbi:MAG TPA: replication-relaxation family protein [Acidimicrobiales bacterium]|nr:replication-relaxation family protein [Acidimicrobiales bacterium]
MRSVRPSDRAECPASKHLLAPGVALPKANDGLGTPTPVTTRVSKAAARRIADTLSDTDRSVVTTLATVTVATGGQLRRLHWPDNDTGRRLARRHLAALTRQRVIARLHRRVGGHRPGSDSYTYRLDVVGQRLVTDDLRRFRRPWTPGHAYLAHAVAVTECYVVLTELTRQDTLELLAFQAEPACWRSHATVDGRPQFVKPDAFAVTAHGDWELRHFIEVDLATEHPARITRKAREYVEYWQNGAEQREHGVFPKVLWVAPDAQRASVLVDAMARLDPDCWRLFQVCDTEHFADTMILGTTDADAEVRS